MSQNLDFDSPNSHYAYSDPTTKDLFGRLYKIDVANSSCPTGWHLPSDGEWKELEIETGIRSSIDENKSYDGNDATVLLKGGKTGLDILLGEITRYKNLSAVFWTSSYNGIPIITRYVKWDGNNATISKSAIGSAQYCFVRCLKNQGYQK